MPQTNHSAPKPIRFYLPEFLLHFGFALTGVGTVLLGCILPQVSAQWHLRDKDAGLLLLVQFAASASGALLVRRNLWKTLARGYGLMSAGAVAIFLLQQSWFSILVIAFAGFGLGLGLAMTSTNILVGRRYPDRRGSALALLNFSWSAGAVACPLIVTQFLHHPSGVGAFALLGVLAAPCVALPLVARQPLPDLPSAEKTVARGTVEANTIVYYAGLAFLYVGMEATVGNWLSTYATRATSGSLVGSVAVAFFWSALLLGRATTPVMLTFLTERRLHWVSVIVVIGGLSLLLSAHNPRTVLAGSALTGLALAPVFPLILSLYLADIGDSQNAGWVFAIAGFGGAILSWLTGIVSTVTGSLRIALLVPGAAALLMMSMISYDRTNHQIEPSPSIEQDATFEPTTGRRS
jgi:MFS transporter, FHS family, glucose/mannose:H+ symporter